MSRPVTRDQLLVRRSLVRGARPWAILLTILLGLLSGPLQAQPAATSTVYLPFISRDCGSSLLIRATTYSHFWNIYSTSYRTVGEIVNTSSMPIYDVKVTLRSTDRATQQEELLVERSTFLPETRPGVAAPFVFDWSGSMLAARPDLSAVCVNTSTHTYAPLMVLSAQIDTSADQVLVTGTVRNDQQAPLDSLTAVISVVMDDGSLLATGVYTTTGPLLPGATVAYTTTFDRVYSSFAGITAANLRVQAQGVIAISQK
jgi:hypothetical protein